MKRRERFSTGVDNLTGHKWKGFGDNTFHLDEIINDGMNFQHFVEVVECNNTDHDLWGFAFVDYQDAYITIIKEVCIEDNQVWGIFESYIEHTPEELQEIKESLTFFNDCIDSFKQLATEYNYNVSQKVSFYERGYFDDKDYKEVRIECEKKLPSSQSFKEVYALLNKEHNILKTNCCGLPRLINGKVVIKHSKTFIYGDYGVE